MKILICDYTGNSAKWIEDYAIKDNLEIVGTISPATDKKLPAENSWDYILVFENGMQQIFLSKVAQPAKISENRIIFALDWNSWANNPSASSALLNATGGYFTPSFTVQYCKTFTLLYCLQYRGRFSLYSTV